VRDTFQFSFHACSGAVINNFYEPRTADDEPAQESWLRVDGQPDPSVKLVTLTFGGNDAGFAPTLSACASPFTVGDSIGGDGPCTSAIKKAQRTIDELGGPAGSWKDHRTLVEFYRDLRDAAPKARILVVGYPRFFPGSPPKRCGGGGTRNFTRKQMVALNEASRTADEAIRTAAADPAADFEYVDIYDVMDGADVCKRTGNMINRVIPTNVKWSFHPSVGGQDRIAERVKACLDTYCGAIRDTSENSLIYATDLRVLGSDGITYDELQWWWSPDARRECLSRDPTYGGDGAWCNDYYYVNDSKKIRILHLSPDAKIRLFPQHAGLETPASQTFELVDVTLGQLGRVLQDDREWLNVTMKVSGGRVTEIAEVFTP
jgi:lysophospholipase L1-like esterase